MDRLKDICLAALGSHLEESGYRVSVMGPLEIRVYRSQSRLVSIEMVRIWWRLEVYEFRRGGHVGTQQDRVMIDPGWPDAIEQVEGFVWRWLHQESDLERWSWWNRLTASS